MQNGFMNEIRFICPGDFATPEMRLAVHTVGFDRTLTPVANEIRGNMFHVWCPPCDNLRLCIPWSIPQFGNKLVTTGTLLQTSTPYTLSVELARGLCVSVRNQAADWESLGLREEDEFWKTTQEAGRYLFQAIKLSQECEGYNPKVDEHANYSMRLSCKASLLLSRSYLQRVLMLRRITKQSVDAATAMGDERTAMALAEEDLLSQDGFAFDDEGITRMLGEMDKLSSASIFDSEPHALREAAGVSETVAPDDDDDTAIHVVETVPPKHIGIRLDSNPLGKEVKDLFFQTFSHVIVDLIWSKLEANPELYDEFDKQFAWCYSNGFPVTAGPLINFFPQHLPGFLREHVGNFNAICFYAREYVQKTVRRFRSKVSTWIATARVNTFFPLGLNLVEQMELTLQVVSWIRELQPTAEVITSIDQPWGENTFPAPLGAGEQDFDVYPSIVCADYLLRSRAKLSGLQLELNIGYLHNGTYDRPLLDWSRMIDRWSHFGVPLYLLLRVPSSSETDPKALIPTAPIWDGWSLRNQAQWILNIIPMLMSKPRVYGVDWCVFRDYRPHDYPHAGLITADGRVKRSQAVLADVLRLFSADMED